MKKASLILRIALFALFSLAALSLTSCGGQLNTREETLTDDFKTVEIDTDTSDIVILPSENGECKLVCSEQDGIVHTATVRDSKLIIEVSDNRHWFNTLFITKMGVTLYLPRAEYQALILETDTGNITLDGEFTVDAVEASSDTGNIMIKGIACTSLVAKSDTGNTGIHDILSTTLIKLEGDTGNAVIGDCKTNELHVSSETGEVNIDTCKCTILGISVDTGNVNLINVIAEGKFDITSTTGDVRFTSCDAASVFVTTNTGNVKGSFLTDKVIFADTDTGDVDIPKLTSGGKCEITTDTGDIKITIN